MTLVWLAFWIFTTGSDPQEGMRQMLNIEACWAEAAKMQKYFAENHPKSKHFQIDISCITEYYDEV